MFRRSWIIAVGIAIGAATWDAGHPALPALLSWQAALLLGWLSVASWLVDWGRRVTSDFERNATTFCGGTGPWSGLADRIVTRASIMAAFPLVVGADAAVVLTGGPAHAVTFRLTLATATFYYAATGFRGCLLAASCVSEIASAADSREVLNYFHPDGLAGLGFARDFADRISMFMLSGAAALPMAVVTGIDASGSGSTGVAARAIIACLCAAWGLLAVASSLRGRVGIAAAVERIRIPTMNWIATEKRRTIEEGGAPEALERWAVRESAVRGLQTGIFTELGGWRDLFAVGAGALAVWRIIGTA